MEPIVPMIVSNGIFVIQGIPKAVFLILCLRHIEIRLTVNMTRGELVILLRTVTINAVLEADLLTKNAITE